MHGGQHSLHSGMHGTSMLVRCSKDNPSFTVIHLTPPAHGAAEPMKQDNGSNSMQGPNPYASLEGRIAIYIGKRYILVKEMIHV